jgi:hypothetical protein
MPPPPISNGAAPPVVPPDRPPGSNGTASLESLAAVANREHVCGEETTRNGLAHYCNAGAALIEAKRQLRHGSFRTWVEANVCFSYRTARVYMLLAKHRAKWQHAASLRDALDLLAKRDEPVEDDRQRRRFDEARRRLDEAGGGKYTLCVTLVVTFDPNIVRPGTSLREVEDLVRPGEVYLPLKTGRGKTVATAEVQTVESLERIPSEGGDA